MRTFGIVGASAAARVALCRALLPELIGRGLRVSVLLTAADDYDIDKPGKDSFEHRAAGASEVMISSQRRWALMHENRAAPDAARTAVIDRMTPVDLLLLVGGATAAESAIALCDAEHGLAPPAEANIVALASTTPPAGSSLPRFHPDDFKAIASFIAEQSALGDATTEQEPV